MFCYDCKSIRLKFSIFGVDPAPFGSIIYVWPTDRSYFVREAEWDGNPVDLSNCFTVQYVPHKKE